MLSPAEFTSRVGQMFRFGSARLTLVSVKVGSAPGSPQPAFTVIFTGPPGAVVPEGSYDAGVEDGPAMLLHIMPIHTPDRTRQDYQVVFN